MFNAAIFWATVGGFGCIVFVLLAVAAAFILFDSGRTLQAVLTGGVLALIGVMGLALSFSLTNGWESVYY